MMLVMRLNLSVLLFAISWIRLASKNDLNILNTCLASLTRSEMRKYSTLIWALCDRLYQLQNLQKY